MTIATTIRRHWVVVCTAVTVAVLGVVLALATLSDSDATPGAPTDPDPAAAPATPGARPSSGPTGTPAPGSLAVVPAGERPTERPVPLASPAAFDSGLTLRITGAEPVQGVAHGPGELAGPAVRLELELENRTGKEISLETVVVALTYGDAQTPAVTLSGPGAEPFAGTLGSGDTARARYVYAVPEEERARVRVVASHAGSVPAVALTGSVR